MWSITWLFIMLLYRSDLVSLNNPLVDSTCVHRTRVTVFTFTLSQTICIYLTLVHTISYSLTCICRLIFLPSCQYNFRSFKLSIIMINYNEHFVAHIMLPLLIMELLEKLQKLFQCDPISKILVLAAWTKMNNSCWMKAFSEQKFNTNNTRENWDVHAGLSGMYCELLNVFTVFLSFLSIYSLSLIHFKVVFMLWCFLKYKLFLWELFN